MEEEDRQELDRLVAGTLVMFNEYAKVPNATEVANELGQYTYQSVLCSLSRLSRASLIKRKLHPKERRYYYALDVYHRLWQWDKVVKLIESMEV